MMVHPGFSRPSFSASSTMRLPIRSLTDPPALKNSHLATVLINEQISKWVHKMARGHIFARWSRTRVDRLTELALKALRLCNLVESDQGSVSNVLENCVQDWRLGKTITGFIRADKMRDYQKASP